MGAFGNLRLAGLGAVHQLDLFTGQHGLHEDIGHADRDIEIFQIALVLGVDELLDIRVIAAQHAHLCAAARTGAFDGFAAAVENPHIADRAGCAALGRPDPSA